MFRSIGLLLCISLVPFIVRPVAAVERYSTSPGVGPGARVFFTQCYPGAPSAADFRRLSDAGFSVLVRPTDIFEPTRNSGSLEMMPEYFRLAAEAGIDAAVFQGGMASGEQWGAPPRVNLEGARGPYLPAHSAVGWKAIGDTLVQWAELSLKHANFKFVGLDFEFYKGGGPDYGESYDDETLNGFLKSVGKTPPDPLPALDKRSEYIAQNGLADRYLEYQKGLLLREVKKVRARIDAVNPRFQIGLYGWGGLFPTLLRGFATQMAPVIQLDATTYGRGQWDPAYDHSPEGGYAGVKNRPDREGLKWSLTRVQNGCRESRERGYPVVYLGGHWPQALGPPDGSQYKFTARQAFNSAAYGDGYWIWTEEFAPKPWTSLSEWTNKMVDYFAEANAALDKGDFMWSNREPNAVPDKNSTKPLLIATIARDTATIWNPITGERVGPGEADAVYEGSDIRIVGAVVKLDVGAQRIIKYKGSVVRIAGKAAEMVGSDAKVIRSFPAGPGLRDPAIGDVDGMPGEEIVTLNAGWIKIWDPESGVELLRFRVGNEQKAIRLVHRIASS